MSRTQHNYTHRCVEVPFTVKPRAPFKRRPAPIFQEIEFERPCKLHCISFRNFYCSAITIKQLVIERTSERLERRKWKTVLKEYSLMNSCHHEDDVQNYHVIVKDQFNSNFEERVVALRFYLIQPSPVWRSFGLRELTCYKLSTNFSVDPTMGIAQQGVSPASFSAPLTQACARVAPLLHQVQERVRLSVAMANTPLRES